MALICLSEESHSGPRVVQSSVKARRELRKSGTSADDQIYQIEQGARFQLRGALLKRQR